MGSAHAPSWCRPAPHAPLSSLAARAARMPGPGTQKQGPGGVQGPHASCEPMRAPSACPVQLKCAPQLAFPQLMQPAASILPYFKRTAGPLAQPHRPRRAKHPRTQPKSRGKRIQPTPRALYMGQRRKRGGAEKLGTRERNLPSRPDFPLATYEWKRSHGSIFTLKAKQIVAVCEIT